MSSAEMVFWQCMWLYQRSSPSAEVADEFFPLIQEKKIKIKPQPKYPNTDILAIGEMDDGLG